MKSRFNWYLFLNKKLFLLLFEVHELSHLCLGLVHSNKTVNQHDIILNVNFICHIKRWSCFAQIDFNSFIQNINTLRPNSLQTYPITEFLQVSERGRHSFLIKQIYNFIWTNRFVEISFEKIISNTWESWKVLRVGKFGTLLNQLLSQTWLRTVSTSLSIEYLTCYYFLKIFYLF